MQKIAKRLAGNFFYHHGQHRIAGIAVVPLCAGRKFCGLLLLQKFQYARIFDLRNLFRRNTGRGLRHQVFIVQQAGSVVQKIADSNGSPVVWKAGKDIGEPVFVMQLALMHQQHDSHRRELLGT